AVSVAPWCEGAHADASAATQQTRTTGRMSSKDHSVLSLRGRTAQSLGRLAGTMSRALRLGAGESVIGKVATAVDPTLLTGLASNLTGGSVVVLGTNGKTSTTAMIARAAAFS